MTGGDHRERRIALAAVAGVHGVKGEVRLKLFTDSVDKLKTIPRLTVGGVSRRLVELKSAGKAPVARFEGIATRNEAEALRGSLVEADRDALPPLEEGEYYHADLIGIAAVDGEGQHLGLVAAVENYGAGDLLEIALDDGKTSLVPFRDGIADLVDGRVVIDPEFLA